MGFKIQSVRDSGTSVFLCVWIQSLSFTMKMFTWWYTHCCSRCLDDGVHFTPGNGFQDQHVGRVGPNRDEVCLCVSSKCKHLPSDLGDVSFDSLLTVLIESETIVYFLKLKGYKYKA